MYDSVVVIVSVSDFDLFFAPVPSNEPIPPTTAPPAISGTPIGAPIPVADKAIPTPAIVPPIPIIPFEALPKILSLFSPSVWAFECPNDFALLSLCEVPSETPFAKLTVCVSEVPFVLLIALAKDSFVEYAN